MISHGTGTVFAQGPDGEPRQIATLTEVSISYDPPRPRPPREPSFGIVQLHFGELRVNRNTKRMLFKVLHPTPERIARLRLREVQRLRRAVVEELRHRIGTHAAKMRARLYLPRGP